jgi:hypothetical protein
MVGGRGVRVLDIGLILTSASMVIFAVTWVVQSL